jgi:hypothetical protein
VLVGVNDGVLLTLIDGVSDGVAVLVGVNDGVLLTLIDGVNDGVILGVLVTVLVGVGVGVGDIQTAIDEAYALPPLSVITR